MSFSVVLSQKFTEQVFSWSIEDQIALDGGLIRPLRDFGFEHILAVLASQSSVLSVEWIEPVESSPVWALVHLRLQGRYVRLRVDDGVPIRVSQH